MSNDLKVTDDRLSTYKNTFKYTGIIEAVDASACIPDDMDLGRTYNAFMVSVPKLGENGETKNLILMTDPGKVPRDTKYVDITIENNSLLGGIDNIPVIEINTPEKTVKKVKVQEFYTEPFGV